MAEPDPHINLEGVDRAAPGAERLSAILRAIAEAQDRERISIGDLLEALKRRALGALMFIFAIITALPMPPGVSAIVGAPLVFLTAQLMLGMNAWLPKVITDRSLSRIDFTRVINAAAPWLARAEGVMKPRFEFLGGRPSIFVVGFVAFVMALLVLLPIPGANMAPSIAICIIALGLLERDGIWIVIGVLVAVISTVVVAAIYWVLITWTISFVVSFLGFGAPPPPMPAG
jgi:hypothetical protein